MHGHDNKPFQASSRLGRAWGGAGQSKCSSLGRVNLQGLGPRAVQILPGPAWDATPPLPLEFTSEDSSPRGQPKCHLLPSFKDAMSPGLRIPWGLGCHLCPSEGRPGAICWGFLCRDAPRLDDRRAEINGAYVLQLSGPSPVKPLCPCGFRCSRLFSFSHGGLRGRQTGWFPLCWQDGALPAPGLHAC